MPTEAEIRAFYDAVWKARRAGDVVLIKTLLYTGVRVSELVRIRLADVDLDACRIRITQGKGGKDRLVPFPPPSRKPSPCTSTPSAGTARCSCSSPAGRSPTRPRRPQDPRPLHPGRGHHRLDQPPHAAPLPVHLAQDPGHRRRPHPALQRPRHPPVPGDLLPPRPRRRPAALRRRHRRLPRLTSRSRSFAAGDTFLTGTPSTASLRAASMSWPPGCWPPPPGSWPPAGRRPGWSLIPLASGFAPPSSVREEL